MRVLIVDDDPGVCELTRRLLSAWGWEAVRCGSVSDALALSQVGRYDLAVCDVDLPDGDGVALAEMLKKSDPRLRFILASGDPLNRERAGEAGFGAFLDKPFAGEELEKALAGLGARRVLLVEDDCIQLAEYQRALETEGYWVAAVADAEEAVVLAERSRFDVIVTDNILPGMTGLQALPRLQASGAPVVMMSSESGSKIDALLLGASAFLKKPFSRQELGAVVRRARGAE